MDVGLEPFRNATNLRSFPTKLKLGLLRRIPTSSATERGLLFRDKTQAFRDGSSATKLTPSATILEPSKMDPHLQFDGRLADVSHAIREQRTEL